MIPGQKAVKLTFKASAVKKGLASWPWTATWTVPADFPLGVVNFKVNLKSKSNGYGSFVQLPIASAQLNVTKA
jgi:hypothetical protein